MFEPKVIKDYVAEKKAAMKEEISQYEKTPCLAILKVGDVESSTRYVKNKLKDCAEVGIKTKLMYFFPDCSEEQIISTVSRLNADDEVNGYIVQLPLPDHIFETNVTAAIDPKKDADGFTTETLVSPATPGGIIKYLEDCKFDFTDKNVVVIGRSNIVGKPMAKLLLEKNCNVTVIHSKTSEENKREYLRNADLVISAVGKLHVIDKTYELKPTAVLIDVGINVNPETGKLCGDLDYADLVDKVKFISKTPGGTGLTTRLALLENLLTLYKQQNNID